MAIAARFISGACLLFLALAVAHAADDDAAPVAAEEGEEARCVSLRSIRSTRVLDDQTILFEMAGGKTLVNRLPNKCPGLRFEKRFSYRTSLSQLCDTDIIHVITNFGSGASCGLGRFTPWNPPEDVVAPAEAGTLEPAGPAD